MCWVASAYILVHLCLLHDRLQKASNNNWEECAIQCVLYSYLFSFIFEHDFYYEYYNIVLILDLYELGT